MATITADQLLEAFEQMTVLELSEFKKKFEDRFGVTAAAPVAVAAAPAAGGGVAAAPAADDLVDLDPGLGEIALLRRDRPRQRRGHLAVLADDEIVGVRRRGKAGGEERRCGGDEIEARP